MTFRLNRLTRIALLSLLVFSVLGLYFADRARGPSIVEFLWGKWAVWAQLGAGVAVGGLSAGVAWWWIRQDFMTKVHDKYVRLFQAFRLSYSDIVLISLSAGIGEELFFRGAIQSYLGIIWTAILFVALHGYLNPRDWRMASYGVLMTLIIVGLGYMTETIGILSSIVAHVVIDLYLLFQMMKARVHSA
jgi:membrane protease YdiL (CAAX protease family)